MAKKIFNKFSGIGHSVRVWDSILGGSKKDKGPQGTGAPLPIGAINPDGSPIAVDRKRRRLTPAPAKPNNILTSGSAGGTTLGG